MTRFIARINPLTWYQLKADHSIMNSDEMKEKDGQDTTEEAIDLTDDDNVEEQAILLKLNRTYIYIYSSNI